MKPLASLLAAAAIGLPFSSLSLSAAEPVVVHEWGTFTCLQDETGAAIGGINTDDEPLPSFVHRLAWNLLLSPTEAPPHFFQGAPSCHPDVTMRLETPVMYFYPPKGASLPPFDVHVSFWGGWLTEFYPDAVSKAPGLDPAQANKFGPATEENSTGYHFPHLRNDAAGELIWTGLTLGGHDAIPETGEKVWLAPRDVQSAQVETPAHESEKYLFYRGVAHADACLRVARNRVQHTLSVQGQWGVIRMLDAANGLRIPAAWLLNVRPDGTCAFKTLGAIDYQPGKDSKLMMPDTFAARDFSPDNLPLLRQDMHRELVKAGLYEDEADALLNTWQVSYFKSSGLRLFYLCPQAVTEALIPLSISMPCTIKRVMIGRIEIVTPEQRALLKKLAAVPPPT